MKVEFPPDKQTRLFDAISWLRMILCVAVVFLHVSWIGENFPIARQILYVAPRHFAIIAVQGFFFISGLLFFRGNAFSLDIWFEKIGRRIKTLFVPYLIFQALVVTYFLATSSQFPAILNGKFCLGLIDFLALPQNPLWFLRSLFFVSILSPIIYWLIRRTGIVALLALLAFAAICPHKYTPLGLFYFSVGAFFSINKIDLIAAIESLNKWILLVVWLAFCALVPYDLNHGNADIFYIISIIIGIILCFSWTNFFAKNFGVPAIVKYLSSASFFVYCAHFLVQMTFLEVCFRRFYSILPHNFATAAAIFLAYFISLYLLTLLIYAILKRFLPKLLAILTGGR